MSNQLKDLPGKHRIQTDLVNGWATAATASEEPAFRAPFKGTVTAVRFIPKTAVTGNGTNFATLDVRNKGAAGAGTTVVASLALDTPTTDDVAAFDEKLIDLSGTAANLNFAEGDVIAVRKQVTGTGMAIDGIIEIEYVSAGA